MTIDEMRAKVTKDNCGKCFGAMDCWEYGKNMPLGCMINRQAWMCGGPFTQGELHKIMDDEEEVAV